MVNLNYALFNYTAVFLLIPVFSFTLFLVDRAYFAIRDECGALAANVALPMILILFFYYNFGILMTLVPEGEYLKDNPFEFHFFALLGSVYTVLIHGLIKRGAYLKHKKAEFIANQARLEKLAKKAKKAEEEKNNVGNQEIL